MDSSESISLSMDTTTDSIDVVSHFKHETPKKLNHHHHHHDHDTSQNQPPPIFKSKKHRHKRLRTIMVNGTIKLDYRDDEDTISTKLPPDKQYCIVDETPPSSTSSTTTTNDCMPSQPTTQLLHLNNQQLDSATSSASSLATFISCYSESSLDEAAFQKQRETIAKSAENVSSQRRKKSVLFDKVTIYHFNRSQGFTSVPSQGGSTLGMKRKHFLRRRLSVDLYEEVRRRSRRQILLKIHIEKRKQEERELQQQKQSQKAQASGLKTDSSSSSSSLANTPDPDGNEGNGGDQGPLGGGGDGQVDKKRDKKLIDVENIGDSNEDDEDETYSDYSDISDSELESDSYIFLQPLGVKLRRSLLRASGVGRIDPVEKKECKRIRDSRERSGCKCVGQCIPEYCECSRLGVKCHVDRVSFPCGCSSDGCKNPEGRTEFDMGRVRRHFEEKILESHSQLSSNEEEELIATTPSSTSSEESC